MPSAFTDALARRVLFLDGAMGTAIHKCDCDLERDYLGKENCTEILVQTRPEVIQEIHESFLEVGVDAVETDSFGASKLVFEEFDLADQTFELNKVAAEIARAACDKYSTKDKPRFVLGSIGPGTKLPTLGHTTWEPLMDSYTEQVRGLLAGGADALLIETCQDVLQIKCAINAALKALDEAGKGTDQIPILVSVTIETTGTMLVGAEIAAAAHALRPYPIASLGLNCATGPTEMGPHLKWLAKHWDRAITIAPNAGLPALVDGKTVYPLEPEPFAAAMASYVKECGANLVGGCCGTTPEHLRKLIDAVGENTPPVRVEKEPLAPSSTSLYTPLEHRQDLSVLIIGERTNTNGSRKFKRLLNEEDWDGLVSMAKEQVRDGAHILDVCVDYVGRDGVKDMAEVIPRFAQQAPAPLMVDSTEIDVLETALQRAGGKCIVNSMNLEDGEEKLAQLCKLTKDYGAAIVAGLIDEDPEEAMAKTAERKFQIAARIYDLAVNKYGIDPADIFWDPLVFPVTTGVEADRRLAMETIEGIKRISEQFPECQITVGLSNVSFGLRPAARQVLNSVFLHECVEAGLTSAIMHASKILPKARIDEERWEAAIDLLYDKRGKPGAEPGFDPLTYFIGLFPDGEDVAAEERESLADLPLEERLERHVIDGETDGLTDALEQALPQHGALAIINDFLLEGMKIVGERFGRGEMQLPFVLQSAQVMKAAVTHLEPHIPKDDAIKKGKVILATVRGDVHDIGKNLVDIILTNNGYEVVNLGIKQPIDAILKALEEHDADAVGLSGLLVKSVGVMQENLEEMALRNISIPVLLGGAALTRHYAETTLRDTYNSGKVYYGKDAFEGLRVMDHMAKNNLDAIENEIAVRLEKRAQAEAVIAASPKKISAAAVAQRSDVATDIAVPTAPFWGSRVVDQIDINDIYPFVNPVALFRGQWQFKRGRLSDEAYEQQLQDQVWPLFRELQQRCKEKNLLQPAVVYGYYPVQADGDDLIVFDADDHDKEIERFSFPRQPARKRLCIADFFRSVDSGEKDVLALHCVTMGHEMTAHCKELFDADNYKDYLYMHGMGVEAAEALAELWHKRVRQEMGIGGEDKPTMRELFGQGYRGSRYSFGYPACPDMSDQEKLFRLIGPERIGCLLTENWQIDPEQSTSALVVHHPEAKYFNA